MVGAVGTMRVSGARIGGLMALSQTMALNLSDPPAADIRTMPKNTWLTLGEITQSVSDMFFGVRKFNLNERDDPCVSVLCKRFEGDEGRHFFVPVLSAFASLNEVE